MTREDRPELFDEDTRERVRQEHAASTLAAFAVVTLLVAGLMAGAHHEMPVLARMAGRCAAGQYAYECEHAWFDVLAGAVGLLLFGAFALLAFRYRRVLPTVYCISCGRMGWVLDLEPREGRCPRCGGSRFDYRIFTAGGPEGMLRRIVERDTEGAALVERYRCTRRSWFTRYY